MNTQQQETRSTKPNRWLAVILGFFFPTFGQLYVAQPTWALVYFVGGWTASVGLASIHGAVVAKVLLSVAIGVTCAVQAYRFAVCYPADQARPRYSRWIGVLGLILLSAIPLSLVARTFVVEPFRIPSNSMRPTLVPGNFVVAWKWGYGHYSLFGFPLLRQGMTAKLHHGDIIVFDYPKNPRMQFVKRVIGLPGDTLIYRDDKTLLLDGKKIAQRKQCDCPKMSARGKLAHLEKMRETLDGKAYSVLENKDAPWFYPGGATSPRVGCVYGKHALSCTVPAGEYFVLGDNRDDSLDSRYWGFVPAANVLGKVRYIW